MNHHPHGQQPALQQESRIWADEPAYAGFPSPADRSPSGQPTHHAPPSLHRGPYQEGMYNSAGTSSQPQGGGMGRQPGPLPPNVVYVAPPKLEPQPWARNLWSWLRSNTAGVVRVDLRRPTPPPPNQYRRNNIFVAQRVSHEDGNNPTGARVKLTRSFLFGKDPTGRSKPAIDIGVGVAVEMDRSMLEPVARIKFKNLVSIKAFPHSMLKVAGSVPLLGTGLTAKIVYELPFNNVQQFWNPPARLMIRLDNAAGSGLHLSPTGIEFDEKFVQLGSRLSVRAALGLQFPRSLPIDPETDSFGFKVHRLSLKSLW